MTTVPIAAPKSGRWKLAFRLAAGGLLVGVLCWRIDWQPVAAALEGLRWGHWLAALGIYLMSQLASAWRWGVLARPLGFQLPQRRFVQLYFQGMFFSLCLPSSIGGDVLKAYRLAPTAAGRVLAGCTVLADRATGLVGLAVIGVTALAARALDLSPATGLLLGLAVLAAALACVLLGLKAVALLDRAVRPHSRIGKLLSQLGPYHARPMVFCSAVGWGLVVQSLSVLTVAEVGVAMNLPLPVSAYCVSVPAIAILTMLPVSISGVGVREGGMAYMLSTYGLAPALGVTLGMLWLLVTIAGGLIGGVLYLTDGHESEIEPRSEMQPEVPAPSLRRAA